MSREGRRAEKRYQRLARLHWRAKQRKWKPVSQSEWRCGRKRRFISEEATVGACRQFLELHGELMTAYRCELCGYWHIGHGPAGAQRGGDGETGRVGESDDGRR